MLKNGNAAKASLWEVYLRPHVVARWALIANIALALSTSVRAQDLDNGKAEFLSNCATCHGADGKGLGPSSSKLRTRPANLTVLAKRNNGVFSPDAIHDMIDGRKATRSHRGSEMPIWGCRHGPPPDARPRSYEQTAIETFLDLPCDSESAIQDRIRAVVEYLGRIQEK